MKPEGAPSNSNTIRDGTAADFFIIATAKVKGFVVVTEEGPTGKLQRPNIPDVCRDHGVDCINLIKLIRAEAWVIS